MSRDPFAPNLLARLPFEPKRVVVLRASRIGDFLCAVPALRALRSRLPAAEITMLTVPLLEEYASRLSYLDRVWPFPGFPGLAEQFFEARSALRFFQQAQNASFDLAIQMQGTGVYSNPFVLLLGARATAGFVRQGDPPGLLDAALPYPHGVHEIRCVLALTNFLGAPACGEQLEFPLRADELEEARTLLERWPRPWIGLHASSRDKTRQWPLKKFVALAEQLGERFGGTFVLLGDREAMPAGEFLAARLSHVCLNLIGKISLMALGAIIAQLSVLVTNDSGPAHIAYALNVPTVTLFGSSGSPATNGPLQPGPFALLVADPSSDKLTADQDLPPPIDQISVSQVLAATEALFS